MFVRGNPLLLAQRQLAIVGSRNPSSSGIDTAFEFAKTLSNHGFVITSGLALGIDAALHEITRQSGLTLDATVVDACLRIFNDQRYQFEDWDDH